MAYDPEYPDDSAQPDLPATDDEAASDLPDDLPSLEDRVAWVEDHEEATRENNALARRDRAYKDGDQWSDEDLATLRERHQPALTKNRIAKKVNFIIGEEIAKRVDPIARPRTPSHDDGESSAATDMLRFVEEEQEFDYVRTAVLENMLVEGFGGAVKSYNTETGKHELAHVQWDRLGYDPHSRALNFSDARYKHVEVWMDLDDAIAEMPWAADDLEDAVTNNASHGDSRASEDTPRQWVDAKRKRVRIVDMYFQHGADWFIGRFTKNKDLVPIKRTDTLDEHGHSVCELEMASCYVDQDGMRYGMVRGLISPQDEVNKRASKALHLLSVNSVIAESDTLANPDKFMAEIAKPDGFAEVAAGTLSEQRVLVHRGGELALGHVQLMQSAMNDIDAQGPSASMLPGAPATSGREVLARKQAASQELGSVFDSLRRWSAAIFKLDWLCIRAHTTDEKWLRVTDDEATSGYRWTSINQQMTRAERVQDLLEKQPPVKLSAALEAAAGDDASIVMSDVGPQHQAAMAQARRAGAKIDPKQAEAHLAQLILAHPLMQEMTVKNQVAEMLVDIIIDDAPDTGTLAQEEFETLSALAPVIVQARPDMAPKVARMIVNASSLPNKRELIAEWDKVDPKQAEQQQMMQQLAAKMAQLEAGLKEATIAVAQSQAQLNQAKAQSEMAGAAQPQQPPPPPGPLEIAKAQREAVNTELDVTKSQAQVEKDRALAAKHSTDAAATMHEAMKPEIVAVEVP